MTVHDLKDLASIYYEDDDYEVVVWDPVQQKRYNLIFTGSSNVDKVINFNINEVALTSKEMHRIEVLNDLIRLSREKASITKQYDALMEELKTLDNEQ